MSSVTSQKFSAIEVVDSLKLSKELVFSELAVDGETLSITASSSISLTSDGPIVTKTPESPTWILGGFEDGIRSTDGEVLIGHDADGTPIPVVHTSFDSATFEARLGLYGATPVAQATTAIAPVAVAGPGLGAAVLTDSTFGGYTLAQVVAALQASGIIA